MVSLMLTAVLETLFMVYLTLCICQAMYYEMVELLFTERTEKEEVTA
jgi:hypothetical protein